MKTITPLHSRANVVPRPDIHSKMHKLLFEGGRIETDLFGSVHVGSSIQYRTPCPRNSFAFGEVKALGLRDRALDEDANGVMPGDIIGFDLFQCGHQIDARPYYPPAEWFVSLPWREICCRFTTTEALPVPVGWWIMAEPDPIQTRALVFGTGASSIALPGQRGLGLRTNDNTHTKVKLAAAKLIAAGPRARSCFGGAVSPGDWLLYNPIDGIEIDYVDGQKLVFVKWDDLEQAVSETPDDGGR